MSTKRKNTNTQPPGLGPKKKRPNPSWTDDTTTLRELYDKNPLMKKTYVALRTFIQDALGHTDQDPLVASSRSLVKHICRVLYAHFPVPTSRRGIYLNDHDEFDQDDDDHGAWTTIKDVKEGVTNDRNKFEEYSLNFLIPLWIAYRIGLSGDDNPVPARNLPLEEFVERAGLLFIDLIMLRGPNKERGAMYRGDGTELSTDQVRRCVLLVLSWRHRSPFFLFLPLFVSCTNSTKS